MKAILSRLVIVPIVIILVLLGIALILIVAFPYWVITGNDFLMDKYMPLCEKIIDCLKPL